MTAPGQDWVEQARRFAAGLAVEHGPALAGWAEQARRFTAGLAADRAATTDAGRPAGAPTDVPAGECGWCPVCAGLAALRGQRPDLAEALADVLSSAATALRAHTATTDGTTRTNQDGSDAGPGGTSPDVPAPDVPAPDVPTGDSPAPPEETVTHPAPAPVQRIDVA